RSRMRLPSRSGIDSRPASCIGLNVTNGCFERHALTGDLRFGGRRCEAGKLLDQSRSHALVDGNTLRLVSVPEIGEGTGDWLVIVRHQRCHVIRTRYDVAHPKTNARTLKTSSA